MSYYSLAVSSKAPLQNASNLRQQAYLLGELIASKGYVLLSSIGFSLAYQVAAGVSHKAGLSIGFSPAVNIQAHVLDLQLPLRNYDWIHYTGRKPSASFNDMIRSSQALVLIGAAVESMPELSQALELLLPVAVLVDEREDFENNGLLKYLNGLSDDKQQRVVVHQEASILFGAFDKVLKETYADLSQATKAHNEQLFQNIMKDVKQDTSSSEKA